MNPCVLATPPELHILRGILGRKGALLKLPFSRLLWGQLKHWGNNCLYEMAKLCPKSKPRTALSWRLADANSRICVLVWWRKSKSKLANRTKHWPHTLWFVTTIKFQKCPCYFWQVTAQEKNSGEFFYLSHLFDVVRASQKFGKTCGTRDKTDLIFLKHIKSVWSEMQRQCNGLTKPATCCSFFCHLHCNKCHCTQDIYQFTARRIIPTHGRTYLYTEVHIYLCIDS